MSPEMVGWLVLYSCVSYVVVLIFRFFALESEGRSLRKLVFQPGLFEFNKLAPLWEQVLSAAVMIALILSWPVLVVMRIFGVFQEPAETTLTVSDSPYVAREDMLVRLVSVEEAEEEGQIQDPLGCVPDLTFGFFHETWRKFLAEKQADDELWAFTSQETENPKKFSYRHVRGFVLMRNGEIVGEFIAESN